MTFVSDVGPLAWVATFATIVVCCSVTYLNLRDWRNHWKVDFQDRIPIIVYLGIACIVGAFNAYSPNANAPRRRIEGIARFVAETNGKDGYNEYICVSTCEMTGGYALKIHGRAATAIKIGSKYLFTYLEHPVGNAVMGISLRVVQVSEPDSRRMIYELDLTNHPYRVATYLCDLVLLVCSGIFGAFLRSTQRGHGKSATSDEEELEQKESEPKGDGPISLRLESRDSS